MIPVLIVGALYGIRNFTGEVVTLYTTDAEGKTHSSRIWVVDHGHQIWVRSLDPTSPWLDRLVRQPDVQLRREQLRAELLSDQPVPVYLEPLG